MNDESTGLHASSMSRAPSPVFLPTIVIGTQNWMRENLDVLTYRNGDLIPQVTDPAAWSSLTTGAWCFYNNSPIDAAGYGKLYNWYAVNDPRGLAPQGWHVPSEAEWKTLSDKLGGDATAGGRIKTPGVTQWADGNAGATNESGFTGLPGGLRQSAGGFGNLKTHAYWWSTSEVDANTAMSRGVRFASAEFKRSVSFSKKTGFSVRCIRD